MSAAGDLGGRKGGREGGREGWRLTMWGRQVKVIHREGDRQPREGGRETRQPRVGDKTT